MRVAVSTLNGPPDNINTWSGTSAHFLRAFQELHRDTTPIGPFAKPLFTALNTFSGATAALGNKVNWEAEPAALRLFTAAFDRQVSAARPDVIIAMGWAPYLSKSRVPIVYWGDATIEQRINKAPHWSNLASRTLSRAPVVERVSLRSVAASAWSSEWARDAAVDRYALENTYCVPFASNIADPGPISKSLDDDLLVLLAVGVKWHRKGMDVAVQTADELVKQGKRVELHIVGALPPDDSWQRSHVIYHGFLSKTDPEQASLLHELYTKATLFILPTRNEPFGIVFQEAAAYGVPVISCSVGGVPEVVIDGTTGTLLPELSTPQEYASQVLKLVSDPAGYARISRDARARYLHHFTWSTVARSMLRIARQHVGQFKAALD